MLSLTMHMIVFSCTLSSFNLALCRCSQVLLKQRILKAFADLSMDLLSSLRVFPLRTLHGSDHAQEQVHKHAFLNRDKCSESAF